MFNKTREKLKKTKEEIKEGVERRRRFGGDIWKSFRKFTDWRGLSIDRSERKFDDVQREWGFGTGYGGYRRGLMNNMFMCLFFYVIFAWCAYYFVRSAFFIHNYISAVSCVLGMVVGICVGTVSLWRWMVFRKREYVPFLKWLCGR